MREILAENLKDLFNNTSLKGRYIYNGKLYEVWEVSDKDFQIMCEMSEKNFKKFWETEKEQEKCKNVIIEKEYIDSGKRNYDRLYGEYPKVAQEKIKIFIRKAKYACEQTVYVRVREHHYEQEGEKAYIKYSCPICGINLFFDEETEKIEEKRPATLEEYIQRMSEEEKEKLIRYLKQKRSEGLC